MEFKTSTEINKAGSVMDYCSVNASVSGELCHPWLSYIRNTATSDLYSVYMLS